MLDFDITQFVNSTSPKSLLGFATAISASVVFSMLLNGVHRLYYWNSTEKTTGMKQSFLLIAPAVTAIFLVIQFSLPLSLGLLGALSFVRFRTPVKEPVEIGFLLVVIANSLACAVFRFEVAALLSITLLLVSLYKKYSTANHKTPLFSELFITSSDGKNPEVIEGVESVLGKKGVQFDLVSVSQSEGYTSFHLKMNKPSDPKFRFASLLSEINSISSILKVNLIQHAPA